jgi:hypothetical protein
MVCMLEVVSKRLAWLTFVVALPHAACGGGGASDSPAAVSGTDSGAGPGSGSSTASSRAARAAAGAGGRASSTGTAGAGTRTAREGEGGERSESAAGASADVLGSAGQGGAPSGDAGRKAPAGGAGGRPELAAGGGGSPQPSRDAGAAGMGGTGGMPAPRMNMDIDASAQLGSTGLHVSEILGYFTGDWGELALELRGADVWGSCDHSEGAVVLNLREDGVLAGWWSEAPARMPPESAGEMELRFARHGDAIAVTGRLRNGAQGEWRESIHLLLVNGQDAPDSLTERFDDESAFKAHP